MMNPLKSDYQIIKRFNNTDYVCATTHFKVRMRVLVFSCFGVLGFSWLTAYKNTKTLKYENTIIY